MDIVGERNSSAAVESVLEDLDALADLTGSVVLPVEGVDAGLDYVISQASERLQRRGVVAEVGRAHVGREFADDVEEGVFEECHFGSYACSVETGEVCVAPPALGIEYGEYISL